MSDFGLEHERHLASYSRQDVEVFCDNPACSLHDGATVTYEREYGQGWYTPEECWLCGGEWLEDRPEN